MGWLNDTAFRVLTAALDGLARREAALASNLANIDTPGYRPVAVPFEGALQQELARSSSGREAVGADLELQRSDPRHLSGSIAPGGGAPAASAVFDGSLRNDRNTVDLESEMTALVETQLRYSASARLLSGKLEMVRDVVSSQGGR